MKEFEILQFKYNQHVNNISTPAAFDVNKKPFVKHNISKAKWAEEYKNNTRLSSALLALDKESFFAVECDYKNYIDWLVDGNKTR